MIHVIKLSSNIEGFLIIKYLSYITFSNEGTNHTLAKTQRVVYRVTIKSRIPRRAETTEGAILLHAHSEFISLYF